MNNNALAEVLASAKGADPRTRIRNWQDQIAAFGSDAVAPMNAWLTDVDSDLGHCAISVLERVAHDGHRKMVLETLQDARDNVAIGNIPYLISAIGRIGDPLPPGHDPLHGDACYARGWSPIFHKVVDRIEKGSTWPDDRYLMECGWVFGGKWVEDTGGLVRHVGRVICEFCANHVGRASDGIGERRRSVARADGLRTYVRHKRWHMVIGNRTEAPKLGDVYLTACWHWIGAAGRDIVHGALHAGLESCRKCERNVEAGTGQSWTDAPADEPDGSDWWSP